MGEAPSITVPWRRDLTWCEINAQALEDNIKALKGHLSPSTLIAPAVKSNAYGHGLLTAAHAFLRGGADWLCVHTLHEASLLRESGVNVPIYVFGPTQVEDLEEAAALALHLVLYQEEHLQRLGELAHTSPLLIRSLKLHLKIETGNHRQGISLSRAREFVKMISAHPPLNLIGVTSHFANIEDTTEHRFAELQLTRLREAARELEELAGRPLLCHIANSAASLLWPERALSLARIGIASYGLWPSPTVRSETASLLSPPLSPALSWRSRVAQVREVASGEPIGYGCTYTTTRPTRLAVIPVGYYEGYDRSLSNRGQVLIKGQRAPIRGRVCMNICMVDITDLPLICMGDRVTLIGRDGHEEISADEVAQWANTINYEVVARIAGHLPRYEVSNSEPI